MEDTKSVWFWVSVGEITEGDKRARQRRSEFPPSVWGREKG